MMYYIEESMACRLKPPGDQFTRPARQGLTRAEKVLPFEGRGAADVLARQPLEPAARAPRGPGAAAPRGGGAQGEGRGAELPGRLERHGRLEKEMLEAVHDVHRE